MSRMRAARSTIMSNCTKHQAEANARARDEAKVKKGVKDCRTELKSYFYVVLNLNLDLSLR